MNTHPCVSRLSRDCFCEAEIGGMNRDPSDCLEVTSTVLSWIEFVIARCNLIGHRLRTICYATVPSLTRSLLSWRQPYRRNYRHAKFLKRGKLFKNRNRVQMLGLLSVIFQCLVSVSLKEVPHRALEKRRKVMDSARRASAL